MTTQHDYLAPSFPVSIPDAKGRVTVEKWTTWRPMLVVGGTPARKLRRRTYGVPGRGGDVIPVRLATTLAGNLKVYARGERVARVRQIPMGYMVAAYSAAVILLTGFGLTAALIALGVLYANLTVARSINMPPTVRWGVPVWFTLTGFVISFVVLVAINSAFERAATGG